MAHIKKQIHAGLIKGYTLVEEFRDAWRLLFDNARQFNVETSQIYEDADFLQDVVNRKLFTYTYSNNELQHNVELGATNQSTDI